MSNLTIDASARASFNYAALTADLASAVQDATNRIKQRQDRLIASIIETGDDLLRIKGLLEHGQFTSWLSVEFGMTDRTARNYMSAAAAFKDKPEIISVLPAATVYALAAAPDETRAAVVTKLESGERPDEAEIKTLLAEAAHERKRAAAEAKKTPEQRKRDKAQEQRRAAAREQANKAHQAEQAARLEATARAVTLIMDAFGGQVNELLQALDAGDHYALAHAIKTARGDFR